MTRKTKAELEKEVEDLRKRIAELEGATAGFADCGNEEFLADIIEKCRQPIGVGYPDGRLGFCNRAFCELTGYTAEELKAIDWSKVLTPPEWLPVEMKILQELDRTGAPVQYEKEYIRKDGVRVPIDMLVHVVKDDTGTTLYYYAFVTDITERKRQEWRVGERIKELTCLHEFGRLVEEKGASIDEILAAAVRLLPPAWQFPDDTAAQITCGDDCFQAGEFPGNADSLSSPLLVNGGPVGMVEVAYRHEHPSADEGPFIEEERALLNTFTQRLGHVLERIQAQQEVGAALQQLQSAEQQLRAANQQLEASNQQLRATEQQLRATNQALRAKEQLLNKTGDMARIGGWEIDLATNTVTWTKTTRAIHEVPDDYVPTLEEAIDFFPDAKEELTEAIRRAREEGIPYDMEVPFVTAKGRKLWTHTIGRPEFLDGKCVRLHGTFQDITERRALETRVRQSEGLEAIGQLAGGIAHDFNNLLMGIMNHVELCRDGLDPEHPVQQWLEEITTDSQRSADLTRQLLTFARRQAIAPKVLDLNDAVSGMLKMLQRLIGEDIELAWETGANLWSVRMDPSQVDQMLANLCVNARDAIGGVGKITIETENVELDADYCANHADVAPGAYVMLAVSDTGCGMDREILDHVFEPFFTTALVGEGTGLGLATVHGIVNQNNGHINVYSEPGKGTTFRIYLPRVAAEAADTERTETAEAPRGGDETILLVEDEKSIRVTSAMFLRALGYTVLMAETPDDALRLVAEHAGRVHLLVTDVVMPGMSGRDLAKRLTTEHADLKCLYMSGYTASAIAREGVLEEGLEFLSKPINRDVMARKVREMLDG